MELLLTRCVAKHQQAPCDWLGKDDDTMTDDTMTSFTITTGAMMSTAERQRAKQVTSG
jgi:hypothetical protein